MKDAKKMVLLSWEKWAALRDAGDKGVPVIKVDAGVQTDVPGGVSGLLQGELDEGAGAGGGGSVPSVSLPTPPAEFVKAYFENGGENSFQGSSVSKVKTKRAKPYMKHCKDAAGPYLGPWVHLK